MKQGWDPAIIARDIFKFAQWDRKHKVKKLFENLWNGDLTFSNILIQYRKYINLDYDYFNW